MKEYTCGHLILDICNQVGINKVFGVPGGAIEPFFNAIHDNKNYSLITTRSETGSAFMADGHYRQNGVPAIVCSTTGPGTTNLITSVASAHKDHIPMLVITAQTPLCKFRAGALQDSSHGTGVDILSMFGSITCFNQMATSVEQFQNVIISALDAMFTHDQPAHISVPADIMRAKISHRDITYSPLASSLPTIDVDHVYNMITSDTVLYVGEESSAYYKELNRFLLVSGVKFVAAPSIKGYINEALPSFCGVFGFAGHTSATKAIAEATNILIIGARLDELATKNWDKNLISKRSIHIDQRKSNFVNSASCSSRIYGCVKGLLEGLCSKTWEKIVPHDQGFQRPSCMASDNLVSPSAAFEWLSTAIPKDATVHLDAGNAWAWGIHHFTTADSSGKLRLAMGFGSMGWSVGASIGAAINGNRSIAIVGDGSMLMASNEFTVAVQHGLPVVFIVLNDSAYGMVMHGQRMGKQREIGWELPTVDFAAIGAASGGKGISVKNIEELKSLNWEGIFNTGPTIIDVSIDKSHVPPMGDRVKGISATPGG